MEIKKGQKRPKVFALQIRSNGERSLAGVFSTRVSAKRYFNELYSGRSYVVEKMPLDGLEARFTDFWRVAQLDNDDKYAYFYISKHTVDGLVER